MTEPIIAPSHDALAAAGWPTRGALEFSDVWLTYRVGLDPALRGVTFDVPAGAKVGVCGRTGSGKSSLVVALYRLTEPSSGRVAVDGVDLASVGLATLRQRLGCIPQDPILFSGTVRYNLDPYDAHDDAAVNVAPPLEKVPAGHRLDELVGEPVPAGQKYPGGHAVCVVIVVPSRCCCSSKSAFSSASSASACCPGRRGRAVTCSVPEALYSVPSAAERERRQWAM
jgi:hypothetical protein